MSVPLIPQRLAKCREKIGLNKLEAAKKIGLTQSGYVRYESGQRKPTIQIVEAMAAAFETSVDYLIGLSDDQSCDRVTILKNDNPLLFEIVTDFQHLDAKQQQRVHSYFQKLHKSIN